jgi:hypothetical protein
MPGLLICCYATGTFRPSALARAAHTTVAGRFLAASTHLDHDTICEFRRHDGPVLAQSFVQVLETARELKLLKFGQLTLDADDTNVLAEASKHSAVSHQRAGTAQWLQLMIWRAASRPRTAASSKPATEII